MKLHAYSYLYFRDRTFFVTFVHALEVTLLFTTLKN